MVDQASPGVKTAAANLQGLGAKADNLLSKARRVGFPRYHTIHGNRPRRYEERRDHTGDSDTLPLLREMEEEASRLRAELEAFRDRWEPIT